MQWYGNDISESQWNKGYLEGEAVCVSRKLSMYYQKRASKILLVEWGTSLEMN
jgi:hypothetical protein